MNFIFDWVKGVLFYLGFLKKNATLVVLGLDNAGKTTLLYKLKNGTINTFSPTERPQVDEIDLGNIRFKAWDLGGHDQVRNIWEKYFISGLIFFQLNFFINLLFFFFLN